MHKKKASPEWSAAIIKTHGLWTLLLPFDSGACGIYKGSRVHKMFDFQVITSAVSVRRLLLGDSWRLEAKANGL